MLGLIPTQAVELAREVGNKWANVTVVLYGSFARNEFDDRSDVDLLVIGEIVEDEVRWLADRIVEKLGRHGEKTWNFSFIFAKNIEEVDPSLKAAIATEGVVLLGKPSISSRGFEPHVLFQYDVSKLSATERKRFYRALGATGLSKFRWGSTLLVPASSAKEAEDVLGKHRVVLRRTKVFVKA